MKLSTPHGTLGTSRLNVIVATALIGLSTPHGTLGTQLPLREVSIEELAFNSTRYIRNPSFIEICALLKGTSFNSTRYIRNAEKELLYGRTKLAFNSTRYIRNGFHCRVLPLQQQLSTPHGTLGTDTYRQKRSKSIGLSTPHGTLGTVPEGVLFKIKGTFQLHTVHQELQNLGVLGLFLLSFNSTRYIRNKGEIVVEEGEGLLSTPHGTLGTLGRGRKGN